MNKFNLKEALAGGKVITRDGSKVEQLITLKTGPKEVWPVIVVIDGMIERFTCQGRYSELTKEHNSDLFMAPKKLSGFVNVYNDLSNPFSLHATKMEANTRGNMISDHRIALIDLSQFDKGHGL